MNVLVGQIHRYIYHIHNNNLKWGTNQTIEPTSCCKNYPVDHPRPVRTSKDLSTPKTTSICRPRKASSLLLKAIASSILVMASNLRAMASNLLAMASSCCLKNGDVWRFEELRSRKSAELCTRQIIQLGSLRRLSTNSLTIHLCLHQVKVGWAQRYTSRHQAS